MGIETAIIGAGVLGAGASIYGSSKAAKAQKDAAASAQDTNLAIYQQNREDFLPFYQAGVNAIPYLQAYTGVEGLAGYDQARFVPESTRGTRTTEVIPAQRYSDGLSSVPYNPYAGNSPFPGTGEEWIGPMSGAAVREGSTVPATIPRREAEAATRTLPPGGRTAGGVPTVALPSYEAIVSKPMDAWSYEQSPAYQAKYTLGMEELNKQLQARGLAPSGVGANRQADLARRLTADDYANERSYQLKRYEDLYTGRMAENTTQYNRLLDQIKMGSGAAGSMGTGANQYAERQNQSAYQSGAAEGAFYAGLPNAVLTGTGTGLRMYDYGKNAGWWNSGSNVTQPTGGGLQDWTPEMWG